MFYVPKRNQHLIRSSLPTSHGYEPYPREGEEEIFNPLNVAKSGKSKFVMLFEFVGTQDVSPYLCIKEGLRFRREVCGVEEEIMKYCINLINEGANLGAKILGTEVMQNTEGTLTQCFMANVRLPLTIGDGKGEIPAKEAIKVAIRLIARMAKEYDIYLPVFSHAGKLWTRWSGQIYLDLKDFEYGAEALKAMCERAKMGEFNLE